MAIVIATPAFAQSRSFGHSAAPHQIAAGEMGRHMGDLNLSADQKTKMLQLRTSERAQIEAILTPTQRQQFARLKAQRQANRQQRQGMNLTADQKVKLKAIRQNNQQQFKAILTPAQQAQLGQGGRGWGKRGSMTQLNLTPEQKAKMEQLRASARSQMAAILTPEQQQQAQARQDRRRAMGNNWKSLNLTADQQAKIQAIRQASDRQLNTILTPEQQTKLKSHHHGRGHNRA